MDLLDVMPLGHLRVVAQQFASPAILAQGHVVLLQFEVGYGNHKPLQNVCEGFCGSSGVVGHDANLYPYGSNYGEN